MADKPVKYDVDGYEAVTTALCALINQYPGLTKSDEIAFSSLQDKSGKAMFPVSGAVIESETKNIMGEVTQICAYPFLVIYRAAGLSESRKAAVKEWLDSLGLWLERQPVTIKDEMHKLDEYPMLTAGRKVLSISRQTPAFLQEISDGKVEDWAISISLRYQNNF